MKIGIIVYSQTGNTYHVASKLYERLSKEKYSVKIERIEVVRNTRQPNQPIQFIKTPSVEQYDMIVFASPVEAFSLCPVMKAYLGNIVSLKGKKVACLVTEFLPYPWMGGNRAIKEMKEICVNKGSTICCTGVVNWKNKNREEKIDKTIVEFANRFKQAK